MTEILIATINGREVKVQKPELGQLALVQHQARVLQKDNVTKEQGERALSLVYRVVRTAIVGQEDLDFIEDEIADRALTIQDALRAIVSAAEEQAEAEEAKPVVRRGRPRKKA